MNRFATLIVVALVAAVGQSVDVPETLVLTDRHRVIWDANSEPDIAGYRLFMTGPNTNRVFYQIETVSTQVLVLGELCKTNRIPFGVYRWWVTAFNTAGLESEPSSNLVRDVKMNPLPVFNFEIK